MDNSYVSNPPSSRPCEAAALPDECSLANAVIVVPPVTVPGMVDVLRYQGLVVVPVDIPDGSGGGCGNGSGGGNDNNNGASSGYGNDPCWSIDLVTAILVVHPFGTIVANDSVMKHLRAIAAEAKEASIKKKAEGNTLPSSTSASFRSVPSRPPPRSEGDWRFFVIFLPPLLMSPTPPPPPPPPIPTLWLWPLLPP